MKIAIDLNDVVRGYTAQFAKYYKSGIDRTFDIDTVDVWTNQLREIFPFESKQKYLEFLYNDYTWEIFACGSAMDKNLPTRLNDWIKELENLDEIPEIYLISTGEYDKTIGATYFFLSKIATKIKDIKLFQADDSVWNTFDTIITANPEILNIKTEGKISIKIETPYNIEIESDLQYESLIQCLNDEELLEKITKNKL